MCQRRLLRIELFVGFLLLVADFGSSTAIAQHILDKDPCHARPTDLVAAKNFLFFDQFDKELRVALTKEDPIALAFLVTFPLRVNDAGGTISINDVSALKTHFQEIFTPAVRREILSAKNEEVDCNAEGIGYARGVIWVNASDRGYAIWAVNRDTVPPYSANRWNGPKVEFVCRTHTHRIAVDILASGTLRYRSWNKPRSVVGPPDLEILKGDVTFEGTNVCAVPIYTFRNSNAEYKVEGGLGCSPAAEPKDATGRIEVTIAGKPAAETWCY
jgi:hypothetical protein